MWKGADMTNTHVVLRGSQRRAKGHAVRVREVEPAARRVSVTVTVRGPELPDTAEPLTRAGLEQRYGAEREDIAKVAAALEKYGLKVENSSALPRSLRVGESAGRMKDPLDLGSCTYRSAEQGRLPGRPGQVADPSGLEGPVTGVSGLDQRRVAHRTAIAPAAEHAEVVGDGSTRSLTPSNLETQSTFLAGRASRRTIAIAEFGGAHSRDEVRDFCAQTDRPEQLSNVVDLTMRNDQAATFSSCVVVSSSVTLMPSLNFTPASTSATSSWPLNRRQRSCADSSSL
jgi:hypothetical protein